MKKNIMPSLKIGNLTAKVPIIQGGMGVGISMSGLATAVANQGGIGVIAATGLGMFEKDYKKNLKGANERALRREIRKARLATDGIIGINIMVALTDFDDLIKISIEEGADLLFLGAGLPLKMPKSLSPEELEQVKARVVPIVSSEKAARLIFTYWDKNYHQVPDAVVVEGPMAGGHLGFKRTQVSDKDYTLEKIVPEVVETIKIFEGKYHKSIPVIAGGGVFNGSDIHNLFNLGAKGVQMGTRFVATKECDASRRFKRAFVKSKKEDIVIIDSPVGMPGKAIKNKFLTQAALGEKKPLRCSWKCLKTCDFKKVSYCIALALRNAQLGNLEDGFVFAGTNAYRVKNIISVRRLFKKLINEFIESKKVIALV